MFKGRGLSRRDFLRRTSIAAAGAVGFPYIIPSSALGADGAVAPSNRIVMASIGVGGQGRYDCRALMNLPDVQMVAVCDVDSGHRAAAKKMVEEYYAQKSEKE